MNRTLFIFLILIGGHRLGWAQNGRADSLENFIQTATNDTAKAKAMAQFAYEFRNNDPKKCIALAEKAFQFSSKINFQRGVGLSEIASGTALSSQGNFNEAVIHLNNALNIFKKLNDRSNLCRVYNNLGSVYKGFQNFEEAKKKYNQSIELCRTIGNEEGLGLAANNLGSVYMAEDNYPTALRYFDTALVIRKKLGNKLQMADTYYFIAMVNAAQGLNAEALESLFKILPIREAENDMVGMGDTYAVIGTIYAEQGDYKEAREYHQKALAIAKKADDRLGEGNALFNLGTTYLYENDPLPSLPYFEETVRIRNEINDRAGVANSYANMSEAYRQNHDMANAIKFAEKAMTIYDGLDLPGGKATLLLTLGSIYTGLKKYDAAKKYFDQGLGICYELNRKEMIRDAYHYYIELDSASGNFEKAFEHQKKYLIYRDSVSNEENTKKMVQAQMQFEFDKREAYAKSQQERKDQAAADEQTKQRWVRNAFVIGFLLMIGIAGLAYRNYKRKKQDNETISKQKEQVEEKNREITQSIEYALRIQTAILPPARLVKQYLPKSFILYLPKDIVAGDFYWMESVGDEILFAACDCTGHGVPGAMVSVICHNALNRSVREFGLTGPAAILDKTAEIVIENFAMSENEIKDGMDISLCVLNKRTNELRWAGANNPLWLLKKGSLTETKADKQPIGKSDHKKPFTEHRFQLEKGDRIYVFTDGFADQFGGEKEKKLTRKGFKDLLLSLEFMELDNQGSVMGNFISDYRRKLEQIDDILVIGVEIQA